MAKNINYEYVNKREDSPAQWRHHVNICELPDIYD